MVCIPRYYPQGDQLSADGWQGGDNREKEHWGNREVPLFSFLKNPDVFPTLKSEKVKQNILNQRFKDMNSALLKKKEAPLFLFIFMFMFLFWGHIYQSWVQWNKEVLSIEEATEGLGTISVWAWPKGRLLAWAPACGVTSFVPGVWAAQNQAGEMSRLPHTLHPSQLLLAPLFAQVCGDGVSHQEMSNRI